jgi:hypothetical protein
MTIRCAHLILLLSVGLGVANEATFPRLQRRNTGVQLIAFARHAEGVATAGKKEYPLPMFVNAALIRPGHEPGQFPHAAPLPPLLNVCRAAAPSVPAADFQSRA